MLRYSKIMLFLVMGFIFAGSSLNLDAKTKETPKDKEKNDKVQRMASMFYDLQKNTVSNFEFYTTNYGIIGNNVPQGVGGGFWPRGSQNQYLFGGGVWFGTMKYTGLDGKKHPLVELSYNPYSGQSWFVPGRIDDGDEAIESDVKTYRTYFSTDFRSNDGVPRNTNEGANWPIWDATKDPSMHLRDDRYYGYYVADVNLRNRESMPIQGRGPAFISGEDIFCTYKDTDLSKFEGGATRRNQGYPLRLQFEQTIYSWGFGDYKDFIFIRYDIINYSTDTLNSCWMAAVMDPDIALTTNSGAGAQNDHATFDFSNPSRNFAYQWSGTDQGEKNKGFGYIGFDFLESPAVDPITKFLRHDKKSYNNDEQLGLATYRNWAITEDFLTDAQRYNALASRRRDADDGKPSDKRFLMATGPFNMMPAVVDPITHKVLKTGDTVRIVMGIIFASPSIHLDPDGTDPLDIVELQRKDDFAQYVYDLNFKAPIPPDRSVITKWTPLNHAIKFTWDSTAEYSNDDYENGMDFLGYKIYRARRTNLDTVDVNEIIPSNQYPSGKGAFGWREIAKYEIPTPFWKSSRRAGTDDKNVYMPFIDSMRIVGPVYQDNGAIDNFAIKVVRIPKGAVMVAPDSAAISQINSLSPIVAYVDTSLYTKPWGPFLNKKANSRLLFADSVFADSVYARYINKNNPPKIYKHNYILDSVMLGKVVIVKRGSAPWNPFLYRKQTIQVSSTDSSKIQFQVRDTVNGKDTFNLISTMRLYKDNGSTRILTMDRMIPRADANTKSILADTLHMQQALDSIYSYIQRGIAKVVFPEFESSKEVKDSVIVPYMRLITNNFTFIDIGDDNKSAKITFDPDPTKTEKLINNVDYYYKILAYDEGDYVQQTPGKYNDASLGLPNIITTYPKAASVGKSTMFETISVDQNIGGLYNFQMFGIDQDRVNQLYANHIFELTFNPIWDQARIELTTINRKFPKLFSLYRERMTLRDTTTNTILYDGLTFLEPNLCNANYTQLFTENTFSYVFADTALVDSVSGNIVTFGMPLNNEQILRSGHFTTGDFTKEQYCYSYPFTPEAYGTLGFQFDYSIKQFGGMYRPDSSTRVIKSNAVTPFLFLDYDRSDPQMAEATNDQMDIVTTTTWLGVQHYWDTYTRMLNGSEIWGSFNNGPGEYIITFEPGGTENIEVSWDNPKKKKTFAVPYLNMKVQNVISYKRPDVDSPDSVIVKYPSPMPFLALPDTFYTRGYNGNNKEGGYGSTDSVMYPDPRNLGVKSNDFIGKYNIISFGFINGRGKNNNLNAAIEKQAARPTTGTFANSSRFGSITGVPIGTQGRYYLSAVSDTDKLDFVNFVNIAGVRCVFDYANKGRYTNIKTKQYDFVPTDKYVYGQDFQVGDSVLLKTTGGALGFPLPGSKVLFKATPTVPDNKNYTDAMMNDIKVVPNPYYLTHEGQRSPYDAKIYFTKLPPVCTIDIYTVMGDLVRSIKHDETSSDDPSKEAAEVWDLLSRNRQRVQSQSLIAVITTPNGAKTVKNFSLIVGGFRLIQQ